MNAYLVFSVFLGYSLLIVGLWAIVTIAVECMLKSRPKLDTSKRQRKLFIHSLSEDWGKVK